MAARQLDFSTQALSPAEPHVIYPRVPLTDKGVSVARAEHAGTEKSPTFHTPNTEAEDALPYGVVFSVGYEKRELYVRICYDVSAVLGSKGLAIRAAEKLTGVRDEKSDEIARHMYHITLALRYGNGEEGPFLVKHSEPISREFLETALNAMTPQHLKSFLKRAKI